MNLFQRAKETLAEIGADAWLISCVEGNDIHSKFILDVNIHIRHYIFISQKGKDVVITCPMEKPMAEKALKRLGVKAEVKAFNKGADIPDMLKDLIKDQTIALNFGENIFTLQSTAYAEFIPVGELRELQKIAPDAKFVSAAKIIYALRSIKSPSDIKDLEEAAKINLEILEDIPNWVKIGMTENDVKRKLESKYMQYGEVGFPAIIANNANAADPHHGGSDKKIEKGVLLIDSGMKMSRMTTDITWTYWIGGEPSEKFLDIYNLIYDAKQASFKTIKPGVKANVPDQIIRKMFTDRGIDHVKHYNHGLGHPLGYVVHDIGIGLSARMPDEAVLTEGMVITHEPGLYWQGEWGIRLEDDFVVTKDSMKLLTYCPKDPFLI